MRAPSSDRREHLASVRRPDGRAVARRRESDAASRSFRSTSSGSRPVAEQRSFGCRAPPPPGPPLAAISAGEADAQLHAAQARLADPPSSSRDEAGPNAKSIDACVDADLLVLARGGEPRLGPKSSARAPVCHRPRALRSVARLGSCDPERRHHRTLSAPTARQRGDCLPPGRAAAPEGATISPELEQRRHSRSARGARTLGSKCSGRWTSRGFVLLVGWRIPSWHPGSASGLVRGRRAGHRAEPPALLGDVGGAVPQRTQILPLRGAEKQGGGDTDRCSRLW